MVLFAVGLGRVSNRFRVRGRVAFELRCLRIRVLWDSNFFFDVSYSWG